MIKKITGILTVASILTLFFPRNVMYAETTEFSDEFNFSLKENSVDIYWNDVHQQIDGFGGSIIPAGAEHMFHHPELIDFLFDPVNGLGFSIARTCVLDDGGTSFWGENTASHMNKDGSFNWEGDSKQVEVLKTAQKYGVQIMATPWSPPSWMKSNNQVSNGGKLLPEYYDNYAEYLAQYVKGYKEQHGLDIAVLSVQNEPDANPGWSSCMFTGDEFDTFLKESLIPTFEKENLNTKLLLNENSNFVFPKSDFPYLEDEVRDSVSIIGAHSYWGTHEKFPRAKELMKRLWQTETSDTNTADNPSIEYGLGWAEQVHALLTVPEVNAFLYWYMVHRYANCEALITCLDSDGYVINKRAWTFANYSKYVRPGYWRIGATESPYPDSFITAFKDEESGKCVAVCINDSSETHEIDFNLNGFKAQSVSAYRTSATEELADAGKFAVSGNDISVVLNPRSITTYVFDGCVSVIAPTKVEAETGSQKIGNAHNCTNEYFSMGQGVGDIGAKDNGAAFNHLPEAEGIVFRYSSVNASDCSYNIYVNDNLVNTTTFPSTVSNGEIYADVQLNIKIPNDACVKLTAEEDCSGIILDYITLQNTPSVDGLYLLSAGEAKDYSWAADSIKTVNYVGLMNIFEGTEGELISRGDFVDSLIKALDINTEWNENFFDVYDGTSYYNSIGIGRKTGILSVNEENMFYPDKYLKRRDMFIITANAIKYMWKNSAQEYDGEFLDWDELNEEECSAVTLLLEKGLIEGSNKELNPDGYLNNAAAAVIISKLLQ